MIYLGTLGRMVKLPYVTAQQVEAEERYSFQITLEGRKKAQPKPRAPRTWALSTEHFRPNEAALLQQFADGAWGNGPFIFVSADAPVSNMLTPGASTSMPGEFRITSGVTVTEGSPLLTPDGWAARSLIKSTNNGLFLGAERVPVLPGTRVTVAAYVRGSGGAVRVAWYDAAGAPISTVDSTVRATGPDVVRSWLTATVPANAVTAWVAVNSAAQQVAWPSVTWSDHLLPYGPGQGCLKSVVHSVSSDVRLAVPGATYLNLGFTVSEVG